MPLSAKTRGLIGAKELARMKKTAVLVNTARGPVVDEGALARALKSGAIRAAVEIVRSDPRLRFDRLSITEVAGGSAETVKRKQCLEGVLRNAVGVMGNPIAQGVLSGSVFVKVGGPR